MLTVFVDESGADGNNRYLVHGAMFIRDGALSAMRGAVGEVLIASGCRDELKWTGVSRATVDRDLAVVRVFFDSGDVFQPTTWFQCLVVDQHRVSARAFHAGDRDLCFYKLLYQLLVKRIGESAYAGENVHVVLDERNTRRYDLRDLREVLGHGLRKKRGEDAPRIRSVEYRDSKHEEMLQVADFLTGAVCFYQNGRHLLQGTSLTKIHAAAEIARMNYCQDFCVNQRYDAKFGIWTIKLREARR